MQIMRVTLGTLTGLGVFWGFALFFLENPLWQWCVVVLGASMTLTIFLKGFYIGMDSLRGRFHAILGTGAALLTLAIIGTLVEIPHHFMVSLHCLARVVFVISVALMHLGLKKQGYSLSITEWAEVLVVFVALAGTGLWFFYVTFTIPDVLLTLLVYLSLAILLITLSVVRIYLGSNLGWLWTLGAVSVLFITLGDIAMAYSSSAGLSAANLASLGILQYSAWGMLCLIMTLVSLQFE